VGQVGLDRLEAHEQRLGDLAVVAVIGPLAARRRAAATSL